MLYLRINFVDLVYDKKNNQQIIEKGLLTLINNRLIVVKYLNEFIANKMFLIRIIRNIYTHLLKE